MNQTESFDIFSVSAVSEVFCDFMAFDELGDFNVSKVFYR